MECGYWPLFRSYAIGPLLPESIKQLSRFLRLIAQSASQGNEILNPAFAKRIEYRHDLRTKHASNPSRQVHYRHLTSGVIPFALEVADRFAARCSVEPRYPFLDRRLVEYCFALPIDQKCRNGWTRVIVRRALKDILPPKVCWRTTKSDLAPNFNHCLLKFERSTIDQLIARSDELIRQYVDIKSVKKSYERYLAMDSVRDAMTVWKALTLAQWLGGKTS
jgi:asparagine synthase (glutamine-hydrolysing)